MTGSDESQVATDRRRFQFGLRHLLLATAIIAVLLGTLQVSSAITITLLVSVCPAVPTAMRWKKPNWGRLKFAAAVTLFSLLWFILYALSIGPMLKLTVAMGWDINLEIPYSPIIYLYHYTPLKEPIAWYVEVWI